MNYLLGDGAQFFDPQVAADFGELPPKPALRQKVKGRGSRVRYGEKDFELSADTDNSPRPRKKPRHSDPDNSSTPIRTSQPQLPPTPFSGPNPARNANGADAITKPVENDLNGGAASRSAQYYQGVASSNSPSQLPQVNRRRGSWHSCSSSDGPRPGDGFNPKKRAFYESTGPGADWSDSSDSSDYGDGNLQNPMLDWRRELQYIYHMLNNPGKYAYITDTWKGAFRNYPLADSFWYRRTREASTVPRIYERTPGQEFRGSKVFIKLAELPSRVRDIKMSELDTTGVPNREDEEDSTDELSAPAPHRSVPRGLAEERARHAMSGNSYAKKIKPCLTDAIKWAWADGKLTQYGKALPSNIIVFEVTEKDSKKDAKRQIRRRMDEFAARWRSRMEPYVKQKEEGTIDNVPEAPILYGFAIVEHNLYLVHIDPCKPCQRAFFQEYFNMETDNQRQWYTIMIMLVICWARDKLILTATEMGLEAVPEEVASDPDA
ncbi:hypothetical protein JX266_002671 [Neoarthrinium moseri]|nr:hypothetical protein JX266_002671 [Neoarthrinium moseri]